MFDLRTLLLPTDGSACAEAARPVARRLARRYGADLHVLHVQVVPPTADPAFDPAPQPAEWTEEGVLEVHRRSSVVGEAILAYADEVGADLLVMGTHGRTGLDRLALGSTAERVLRQSPCPVLTVGPEATSHDDGPVLAPLAFDSASDVGLETAAALAEDDGTPLVAVHVVEPAAPPVPYAMALPPIDAREAGDRAARALRQWVAPHAERVPVETEIRFGVAAAQVVEAARERGARLLVQASHGRRGVSRWLLGSVAEEIVRHAPCPVLTLRMGGRGLRHPSTTADLLPVPRAEWAPLFDALSERAARTPHTVSLSIVSPETEGPLFDAAPLVGVTYDPREDAVEVHVEGGGHHVVRPFAVRAEAGPWAPEAAHDATAPGPWTLDIVRADGGRERLVIAEATAADAAP